MPQFHRLLHSSNFFSFCVGNFLYFENLFSNWGEIFEGGLPLLGFLALAVAVEIHQIPLPPLKSGESKGRRVISNCCCSLFCLSFPSFTTGLYFRLSFELETLDPSICNMATLAFQNVFMLTGNLFITC